MTWHVYIVRCADETLYTGIATEVTRRVAEHNGVGRAGARYTRARRPVRLVYQESAPDRSAAAKREYAIKRLSRAGKMLLLAAYSELKVRRKAVKPRARRTTATTPTRVNPRMRKSASL